MFLCHVSSVVSSTGAAEAMPAFETRMSRPPYSPTARSNDRATDVSSVTSQGNPRTRSLPWACCNSAVTVSRAPASTSVTTTHAPSASSRSAVAPPIPPAPPVTSAIRPSRPFGFGSRCSFASSSRQYSTPKASCSEIGRYSSTPSAQPMTLMVLT